jgi:hypothetical protein
MRRRAAHALGTLILAVLGLAACAPREQVDPLARQAAEDLAWLKENKPILDAKRQELQEIRDVLAGKAPAPDAGGEEGEGEGEGEPPPNPEELEGRATALEDEIDTLAEQVGEKVVSFLNNSDIQIDSAGSDKSSTSRSTRTSASPGSTSTRAVITVAPSTSTSSRSGSIQTTRGWPRRSPRRRSCAG